MASVIGRRFSWKSTHVKLGLKRDQSKKKKKKVCIKKEKSDVSALIPRCMRQWEVMGTWGLCWPHSAICGLRGMKGLRRFEKNTVFAPSQVFLKSAKIPLHFPDISTFSPSKTPQTPWRTFLLEKRGSPPLRSRQSCWCLRDLCTLVWKGLPPAGGGRFRLTSTQNLKEPAAQQDF